MTMPVGLDLDGRPGVDGFSLKVYAGDAKNPKPIPITQGELEIVMWDGTLFGRTNLPPPLRVWKLPASDLSPYRFQSGIGIGYEFSLAWGTNQPTQRLITVAARYHSPEGRRVTSSPASVTVID